MKPELKSWDRRCDVGRTRDIDKDRCRCRREKRGGGVGRHIAAIVAERGLARANILSFGTESYRGEELEKGYQVRYGQLRVTRGALIIGRTMVTVERGSAQLEASVGIAGMATMRSA